MKKRMTFLIYLFIVFIDTIVFKLMKRILKLITK